MTHRDAVPPLFPPGTFTGVPSHFRGWCLTASQGGNSGGYRCVGRNFGRRLLAYEPSDLDTEEWLTLVDRMSQQYLDKRHSVDREGLTRWLHRHFPLMMKLVSRDRFDRFLDGVVEAYAEGEMMEDFPAEFETVNVNLDDACRGAGYVRVFYHRPYAREVVYQCPALSCREASRAAVEEYAKRRGSPIVDLGETIATVVRTAAVDALG